MYRENSLSEQKFRKYVALRILRVKFVDLLRMFRKFRPFMIFAVVFETLPDVIIKKSLYRATALTDRKERKLLFVRPSVRDEAERKMVSPFIVLNSYLKIYRLISNQNFIFLCFYIKVDQNSIAFHIIYCDKCIFS